MSHEYSFPSNSSPPPSWPNNPLVGQDFLIVEASLPNSVGLLWTRDQPETEKSPWQHTKLMTDIHNTGGIRTASERKQTHALHLAAAFPAHNQAQSWLCNLVVELTRNLAFSVAFSFFVCVTRHEAFIVLHLVLLWYLPIFCQIRSLIHKKLFVLNWKPTSYFFRRPRRLHWFLFKIFGNLLWRRNVHLRYCRLVSLWKKNFWFRAGLSHASTYQLSNDTHTSATD